MLDAGARRLVSAPLDHIASVLVRQRVRPTTVTAIGWLAGVGACLAVVSGSWTLALVLWLTNRVLDGLDGAVARRVGPTDLGGFLDIIADFSIYAGFILAVAIEVPDARLACTVLLVAYYISGTAFLALSSIQERRRATGHADDERSLRFVGGLAEGTETVIVYALFTLLPGHAELIAWVFAAAVIVTAGQRVAEGVRTLRVPADVRTIA